MKPVYMMIFPLLLSLNAFAADTEVIVPALLPEGLARQLLAQDLEIASAERTLHATQIAAEQQLLSPYDWVARGTYQRRDYRNGTGSSGNANSNEWNIGIERTVRLPAKVSADKASSNAVNTLALLQVQQARRQSVSDLLNAWFDWLEADSRKSLLQRQQIAVSDNLVSVRKRVRGGDAAQLEQQLAIAELATVQRQVSEANYLASSQMTLLTERYPTSSELMRINLPMPIQPANDATWWQTRQLDTNNALNVAQAQVEIATAEVSRAKANRLPDPTFGVFTANESYGNERIIGLSASIPLGSKRRTLEVERMQTQLESAQLNRARVEREQRIASINRYNAAKGAFEQWQLAQQTASLMTENAKLTQKAYVLGEGDIERLLLAQRQALTAAEDEAKSKVTALRTYADLLLNAHLLWPNWLN